jgi:hypothetical protein
MELLARPIIAMTMLTLASSLWAPRLIRTLAVTMMVASLEQLALMDRVWVPLGTPVLITLNALVERVVPPDISVNWLRFRAAFWGPQ